MIQAVIADDSALLRIVLKDILVQTGKVSVVGMAKNGLEAIELVKALHPDVLILDYQMPVLNGLETLQRIMNECPLPVFIFSSVTQSAAEITLRALELGAADFISKSQDGIRTLQSSAHELIEKIEGILLTGKFNKKNTTPDSSMERDKSRELLADSPRRQIDIIAIGSSTGGIEAAVKIVSGLPERTKPIVWVQHMLPNFTEGFAQRLGKHAKFPVKLSTNGDYLEENTCYIARGGCHTTIEKERDTFRLKVSHDAANSKHCPSCDSLFHSVALNFSRNALGVILTGMGDDGTKGLMAMHARGAYVIGQSAGSCVVYGMPKSAKLAGAVDIELELNEISPAIVHLGGAQ